MWGLEYLWRADEDGAGQLNLTGKYMHLEDYKRNKRNLGRLDKPAIVVRPALTVQGRAVQFAIQRVTNYYSLLCAPAEKPVILELTASSAHDGLLFVPTNFVSELERHRAFAQYCPAPVYTIAGSNEEMVWYEPPLCDLREYVKNAPIDSHVIATVAKALLVYQTSIPADHHASITSAHVVIMPDGTVKVWGVGDERNIAYEVTFDAKYHAAAESVGLIMLEMLSAQSELDQEAVDLATRLCRHEYVCLDSVLSSKYLKRFAKERIRLPSDTTKLSNEPFRELVQQQMNKWVPESNSFRTRLQDSWRQCWCNSIDRSTLKSYAPHEIDSDTPSSMASVGRSGVSPVHSSTESVVSLRPKSWTQFLRPSHEPGGEAVAEWEFTDTYYVDPSSTTSGEATPDTTHVSNNANHHFLERMLALLHERASTKKERAHSDKTPVRAERSISQNSGATRVEKAINPSLALRRSSLSQPDEHSSEQAGDQPTTGDGLDLAYEQFKRICTQLESTGRAAEQVKFLKR